MNTNRFIVRARQSGKRLDIFLAEKFKGVNSRTKIKMFILNNNVMVNDKKPSPHYIIKEHDIINVDYFHSENDVTQAQDIPLDIIYEDNDIIVINKPTGLVVHPGAGNKDNTLVNALYHHAKGSISLSRGSHRAGIVHRLDKDTSGVIITAKNDRAHMYIAEQFKKHTIKKIYSIIVKGVVQHDQGKCDLPIGRGRIFRKKMVIQAVDGKDALTEYCVIKRFTNATYLKVQIHTGRTHQIRVHMAYLGYPVIGDNKYGVVSKLIDRQCIHASFLEMVHPGTKKNITFEAPIPDDIQYVLDSLAEKM